MTPQEATFLSAAARGLLLHMTADAMIAGPLWGIHILITLAAIKVLWDRGLKTLASRALASILVLIIALSTTMLSLQYAQLVIGLREGFIRNPDVPFLERWRRVGKMNNALQNPIFWLEGFGGFVPLLGDLVVVVRVCQLWMYRRVFLALPIFSLFTCLVVSVTYSCIMTVQHPGTAGASPSLTTRNLFYAAMSTSLGTNIIATGMILFQAYRHRQAIHGALNLRKSRAWIVMVYLIETGAGYCLLQTTGMIITAMEQRLDTFDITFANNCWSTFYTYFAMTYPSLVILLAQSTEKLDAAGGSLFGTIPGQGTHLSFGMPDLRTSSEIESPSIAREDSGRFEKQEKSIEV